MQLETTEAYTEIPIDRIDSEGGLLLDIYRHFEEHDRWIRIHRVGDRVPNERLSLYRSKEIRLHCGPILPLRELAVRLWNEIFRSSSRTEEDLAIRRAVHAVESLTVDQSPAPVIEAWQIGKILPSPSHGLRVAAYSVLFALITLPPERANAAVLADLVSAAIFHDVGKNLIQAEAASSAWSRLSYEHQQEHRRHPEESALWIERNAKSISERARSIVLQHHEKFDGTGYPAHAEGFSVPDLAQLLSMADMIDELYQGSWDEKSRRVAEAFEELERFEGMRTFPQYFNPNLFSALVEGFRSTQPRTNSAAA